METIDFDDLKADLLLSNPEVRVEYDALDEEFAIAGELIAARARAGLSQAEVADRMGTTQSIKSFTESSYH